MPQQQRATMMDPSIEELLGRVDARFTLVTLSAKRARQINSYYNQLSEGLGAIVPPQVASTSRKPLSIALEEIAADKIVFTRPEPVEGEDEAEAEA
ncbi:MAG TPA: DNA-directed RNA polymerase subunit omega [Acidimicrobiales bacterium]